MLTLFRDVLAAAVVAHPWASIVVAYVAGQVTAVTVLAMIPRDPGDPPPAPRSSARARDQWPPRTIEQRGQRSRRVDGPPGAA